MFQRNSFANSSILWIAQSTVSVGNRGSSGEFDPVCHFGLNRQFYCIIFCASEFTHPRWAVEDQL